MRKSKKKLNYRKKKNNNKSNKINLLKMIGGSGMFGHGWAQHAALGRRRLGEDQPSMIPVIKHGIGQGVVGSLKRPQGLGLIAEEPTTHPSAMSRSLRGNPLRGALAASSSAPTVAEDPNNSLIDLSKEDEQNIYYHIKNYNKEKRAELKKLILTDLGFNNT